MGYDKIQTGLRIPQSRYDELEEMAERFGISLNAVILFLVDIGMTAVNQGIDVAVPSHEEALAQGVRTADVWVVEP